MAAAVDAAGRSRSCGAFRPPRRFDRLLYFTLVSLIYWRGCLRVDGAHQVYVCYILFFDHLVFVELRIFRSALALEFLAVAACIYIRCIRRRGLHLHSHFLLWRLALTVE